MVQTTLSSLIMEKNGGREFYTGGCTIGCTSYRRTCYINQYPPFEKYYELFVTNLNVTPHHIAKLQSDMRTCGPPVEKSYELANPNVSADHIAKLQSEIRAHFEGVYKAFGFSVCVLERTLSDGLYFDVFLVHN